jgi:hypothetical protein
MGSCDEGWGYRLGCFAKLAVLLTKVHIFTNLGVINKLGTYIPCVIQEITKLGTNAKILSNDAWRIRK